MAAPCRADPQFYIQEEGGFFHNLPETGCFGPFCTSGTACPGAARGADAGLLGATPNAGRPGVPPSVLQSHGLHRSGRTLPAMRRTSLRLLVHARAMSQGRLPPAAPVQLCRNGQGLIMGRDERGVHGDGVRELPNKTGIRSFRTGSKGKEHDARNTCTGNREFAEGLARRSAALLPGSGCIIGTTGWDGTTPSVTA